MKEPWAFGLQHKRARREVQQISTRGQPFKKDSYVGASNQFWLNLVFPTQRGKSVLFCFFFSFQFYVYSYSPIKLSQFKVVIKSQPQYLTTCQDSVPKMALFCGSLFLLGTIPPGDLTPSLQCSSFLLLSSERKRASLPLPLNGSKGSQGIFGPANRGLCVPEKQSLKLLFQPGVVCSCNPSILKRFESPIHVSGFYL